MNTKAKFKLFSFSFLRKTSTAPAPALPKLTLVELREFVNQVNNLPCIIKETNAIDKLMSQVESFRYDAKIVLNSDDYDEKKVLELLEHAETMDIDLPEINELKLVSWLVLRNIFLCIHSICSENPKTKEGSKTENVL